MSTVTEAEGRKLRALTLLEGRRELWILRGRRALLRAMLAGDGTATIDDVRAAVELPAGMNPVCFGVVPGLLRAAGIIAADGFVTSDRPESHARPVKRWLLVNRAAAEAWLATHADRGIAEPAPMEPDPTPKPNDELLLFDTKNDTPGGQTPGGQTI